MLTNHQRGDHEIPETEEDKNPNNLEKLISSGKKYLKKTGKALVFTTALTTAAFLSGCSQDSSEKSQNENSVKASTIVSQTQENPNSGNSTLVSNNSKKVSIKKPEENHEIPYNKTFSVPAYSEEKDSIERNKLFDENARISVQKDDKKDNELEITLKLEDYNKKKEDPDSEFYLERDQSSPLVVYSPNLEIKEISQRGFANLGDRKGWQNLAVPRRNKDKKLEIGKEKIQEAIDETYFNSEDKKESLEKRNYNWWQGFVSDLSKNEEMQKVLEKALEEDYQFAIIPPYDYRYVSEDKETARKTTLSFEQKYPGKEKVWVIQGAELKRNDHEELFGNLERRLIGPAEIKGKIDPWKYKEGEDFEWFDANSCFYIVLDKENPEKKEKMIYMSIIGRIEDENTKKSLSFLTLPKKRESEVDIEIYEENKKNPEKINNIHIAGQSLRSWGDHNINQGPFQLGFFSTRLGKGKNNLENRYFGYIEFEDKAMKEISKLSREGVPRVYSLEDRGKLKKLKQSQRGNKLLFLTEKNKGDFNKLKLGVFPSKEGKINGGPIIFTEPLLESYNAAHGENSYLNNVDFLYRLEMIGGEQKYKKIE